MKKILFILLSSLVLVSCEGYFDQLPKNRTSGRDILYFL